MPYDILVIPAPIFEITRLRQNNIMKENPHTYSLFISHISLKD